MKRFVNLYLMLLLLASCSSTDVDVLGSVTGIVLDKDTKMPVANCLVSIDHVIPVSTNMEGEYTIDGIEMGNHLISFNATDYQKYNDSIRILEGSSIRKDVYLGKESIPVVTTTSASAITYNSVRLNAVVKSAGNMNITEMGFYFGLSSSNMKKYAVESKEMTYSYEMLNLESNTNYCFRAYAVNGKGEALGEILSLITEKADLAEVNTNEAENVTGTTANLCATIKKMPESGITNKGFYLGTEKDNLSEIVYVEDQDGDCYSIRKNKLQDDCTYYYQAFVESKDGISLGEIQSFKTLVVSLPEVESIIELDSEGYPLSNLMSGRVKSVGNDPDTEFGFCYSEEFGRFMEFVEPLGTTDKPIDFSIDPNKRFQEFKHFCFKAYAKNAKGSSYGDIGDVYAIF